MPEDRSDKDVDSLLNEVNDLADEAVADIVGPESETSPQTSPDPTQTDPTPEPPQPSQTADNQSPSHRTPRPPALNRILNLRVPIIVRLAENRMSMSEILNLSTGAIIEFEKPVDSQLELLANNRPIAQGRAVKVGENFGLRIGRVGSIQDRIQALGRQ